MATHSAFLPGESPWTEEAGGLESMGSQRVRHDWVTKHKHSTYPYVCIKDKQKVLNNNECLFMLVVKYQIVLVLVLHIV